VFFSSVYILINSL